MAKRFFTLTHIIIGAIFFCCLLPEYALADVIWPELCLMTEYLSIPIIALSLIIEFFALKYILKFNNIKTSFLVFYANAVSAFLGRFFMTIAITGLFFYSITYRILNILNIDFTETPSLFITPLIDAILGGIVNTFIEIKSIQFLFFIKRCLFKNSETKITFNRKGFIIFFLANAITVGIAAYFMVVHECWKSFH